ncbi:MAG: HEPN domain-containing protein [Promethearchaeota archaeon]
MFHSQQAAEKALKALLYFNNINGWGHSIFTLLEKYKELKKLDFNDLSRYPLNLDKHYITTRYPDALPDLAPHKVYKE